MDRNAHGMGRAGGDRSISPHGKFLLKLCIFISQSDIKVISKFRSIIIVKRKTLGNMD